MPFKDNFSAHASDYKLHRPQYPQTIAKYLASLCTEKIYAIDIGCGSGQFTQTLTNEFKTILAFDASAEQISHAKQQHNITYTVAPAETIPVENNLANLIVSAQALHWFNIEKFWQEVKRISKPNAIIAVLCYGVCRISPEIDPITDNFYQSISEFWDFERKLIEQEYKTISFPFHELPTTEFEINCQWTRKDYLSYIETWSAVKTAEKNGKEPIKNLEICLQKTWTSAQSKHDVKFPIHMRIGRIT